MRRAGASTASSSNKVSLFEEQLAKRAREKDEIQKRAEEQSKRQRVEVEYATMEPDHDAVEESVEMEEMDHDKRSKSDIEEGNVQEVSREERKQSDGWDMERYLNRSWAVNRKNAIDESNEHVTVQQVQTPWCDTEDIHEADENGYSQAGKSPYLQGVDRRSGGVGAMPTKDRLSDMVNMERDRASLPGWRQVDVDSEYVPRLGKDLWFGQRFEPIPPTKASRGNILVINAPCARAKSSAVRAFMKEILEQDSKARILLLSANILYATNLTSELVGEGFDVGFYREKETDLSAHKVVVCSMESLHHVAGQSFEMVMIDEIRTISGLVGGDTMPHFYNLALLKQMCHRTPRVVACDADVKFTSDATEARPMVHTMLSIISTRPVLCVNLTKRGPIHLNRSVRLFHNHSDAAFGKDAFFAEIKEAILKWKDNNEYRVAVCAGSKSQIREIARLAEAMGVPWKPYSGETCSESKSRLSDPDSEWKKYAVIIFTTTLSVGVDPKAVQFGRVFVITCRTGCNVLTQAQAAMRFGRSKEAPLMNKTISILVDAPTPGIRALEVENPKSKKEKIIQPDYNKEVKKLQQMRSTKRRVWTNGLDLIGGAIKGAAQPALVSEDIICLMAHGRLERSCLFKDVHSLVLRVCQHHGWSVENDEGRKGHASEEEDGPQRSVSMDDTNDDHFAALATEMEKWDRCIRYINENGEETFFNTKCYGFSEEDRVELRTSLEQRVAKAYWLLHGIQRMPRKDMKLSPAKQLIEMSKQGVLAGLQLNALRRCLTPEEQIRRDMSRRFDSEVNNKKRATDPYLKTDIGMRMMVADDCASLLGVASMVKECHLPSRVVDVLNEVDERKKKEKGNPGTGAEDVEKRGSERFTREVSEIAHQFNITGGKELVSTLKAIAKACGMKLILTRKKKQKNGDRKSKIVSASLMRVMPDVVDDWWVASKRLGWEKVRCRDWAEAHLDIELERLEGIEDDYLAEEMFVPVESTASRDVRFEKLDRAAVENEITRLKGRAQDGDHGGWLAWLEDVTRKAHVCKTDTTVLVLMVVYTLKVCGRRNASYPSLQDCPKRLRPKVAGRFYYCADIKKCKPTIYLRLARQERIHGAIQTLSGVVEDNEVVMGRIASFYGVCPAKCKDVILSVLSGGGGSKWRKESGCTRNETSTAPDLQELKECYEEIKVALFRKGATRIAALRQEWKISATAKVKLALVEAKADPTSERKRGEYELAASKATDTAIDRSIFAKLYFEEENKILNAMDESFQSEGWKVGSLIFDACLVEHRTDAAFGTAMKAAEVAVRQNLGYSIHLEEEALFDYDK